jgi:hypothetical protein
LSDNTAEASPVNADRRPIPEEILRAVAEGAMPLAVLADYLDEADRSQLADKVRSLAGLARCATDLCDVRNSGNWLGPCWDWAWFG